MVYCQQNRNENIRCFDSIQLKKIADIIFDRDYYRAVNYDLLETNTIIKKDRDRLSEGLYKCQGSIHYQDSIIGIKDKINLYLKDDNDKLSRKYKNSKRITVITVIVSIIIIIIK